MKHKILLNKTYGGFELSAFILKKYYKIKFPSTKLYFYNPIRKNGETLFIKVSSKNFNKSTVIVTKDCGKKVFDLNEIYDFELVCDNINRTDKVLIDLIEKFGADKASTLYSRIQIEEFEGEKYKIQNYDGLETLITPDTIIWENYGEN